MHVLIGERIGRLGKIRLGCSAAIFDESGTKVLLTQRADNGEWCLPGGLVEPGESVEEMKLLGNSLQRIYDAFSHQEKTFVR